MKIRFKIYHDNFGGWSNVYTAKKIIIRSRTLRNHVTTIRATHNKWHTLSNWYHIFFASGTRLSLSNWYLHSWSTPAAEWWHQTLADIWVRFSIEASVSRVSSSISLPLFDRVFTKQSTSTCYSFLKHQSNENETTFYKWNMKEHHLLSFSPSQVSTQQKKD